MKCIRSDVEPSPLSISKMRSSLQTEILCPLSNTSPLPPSHSPRKPIFKLLSASVNLSFLTTTRLFVDVGLRCQLLTIVSNAAMTVSDKNLLLLIFSVVFVIFFTAFYFDFHCFSS